MTPPLDIVLFSFNPYHGRTGRAHHFARLLSGDGRVFFVDPPQSRLRRRSRQAEVERIDENLIRIALPGGWPGRQRWSIHQGNQSRWLKVLGKLLDEHEWGGRGCRTCLHMTPVWERAYQELRPELTVYDAHDDWRAIAPNRPELIDRLEAAHALSADIILAGSAQITERFATLGREAHELANGCEATHFAQAASARLAADMASIPSPRVLYVGGLEPCLASQAIAGVAENLSDVSFVLVGPEVTPQRALHGLPNVHLLGERPYEELPRYFAGADVCWIPFELTDHATGRDCIKLYEYLATGLPIVTTPLPRTKQFAELVLIAEPSVAALTTACREALADQNWESRQAVAREHTWEKRVADLEALVAGRLDDSESMPTITLVTPTLNQGEFLEETIRSVLDQGYPKLEYVIVDGGSTDNTHEILERYRSELAAVISEPDDGQSDAINKGQAIGGGQIVGWLCGDDTLTPGALEVVGGHFAQHPGCQWLAGAGDFVEVDTGKRTHLTAGFDGRMAMLDYWRYGMAGHYIPQPSCFWRRDLWEAVGGVNVANHLTMDFELWLAMRRRAALHTIDQTLSVSKVHAEAKSTRLKGRQYADTRQRAFAAARVEGVWPTTLIARKLWWTVAWRVGWLWRRLSGSRELRS